jgi:hypothetical protein
MTDEIPRPLGRDDQPTDAADDRLGDLPPEEADIVRLTDADTLDEGESDSGLLPPVVDLDDHQRLDADDPAKPGIDDYED